MIQNLGLGGEGDGVRVERVWEWLGDFLFGNIDRTEFFKFL
jgi:hypothetical protein